MKDNQLPARNARFGAVATRTTRVTAQTQSQEPVRMISQLLAAMSHEALTQLDLIIGLSELLISAGPTTERAQHLRDIQSNCDTLARIAADMQRVAGFSATNTIKELRRFWLEARFGRPGNEVVLNHQPSPTGKLRVPEDAPPIGAGIGPRSS
jgi:signal transduction histidine kinase